MQEASEKLSPQISTATRNATSSPESVVGHLPYASLDGPKIVKSGRDRARASRSAQLAKGRERLTRVTFGRSCVVSSASAALQLSLANRLQARLGVYGSMEYGLIWKLWPMLSGVPICALRASPHRTSGNGFGGWRSPIWTDWKSATISRQKMGRLSDQVVKLFGWATPTAQDHSRGSLPPRPTDTGIPLSQQAVLAGWNTPHCPRAHDSDHSTSSYLDRQLLGTSSNSFSAETGKRAALNPEHSRWLMGYPVEWGSCGATAMQSLRTLRRSSSLLIKNR